MSNVDPFSEENTHGSPSSSTDMNESKEPDAPSPEEQPNQCSSKSLLPEGMNLFSISKTDGGHLQKITNSVSDAVSHLTDLDDNQKEIVRSFFESNAHGSTSTMSMECHGEGTEDSPGCPFLHVCPLYAAKADLPVGKKCPVEDGLVRIWVDKHLMSLGITDHLDPENSFDMEMLYELATHRLIQWRAQAHLSKKGALVEEKIIGYSNKGQPMFADVLSPLLETLTAHNTIAMKIRDALLATRKAQIQAGRDMGDNTRRGAELSEKARQKALDRLKAQREKVKDADFTEVDDREDTA